MNDDFKSSQTVEPIANESSLQATSQEKKQIAEKKKYSKVFSFLSIILLLATSGVGVITYFWYQAQQENVAYKKEISALQTTLGVADQTNIATEKAKNVVNGVASFSSLITSYHNILEASVDSSQADFDSTSKQIEASLKDYNKASSLPQGWAVLAVYQVVKPNTQPSGVLNALVYWPASNTKPADFIPMIKEVGGKWQYDTKL